MRSVRLFGLAVVAVLAMSVVASSVASAAAPEFIPSTKQAIKGTSGTGQLEVNAITEIDSITCKHNASIGEITGAKAIGGVQVTYTECEGKQGSGTACKVHSKSPKGAEGEIKTNTVKGELGTVAKGEAASEVGVLFKPASGSIFVEIEKAACSPGGAVEGELAGEASPIKGGASTTGKLVFVGSKGVQGIKKFNGKEVKVLKAFSIAGASLNDTENLTFAKAVEVT